MGLFQRETDLKPTKLLLSAVVLAGLITFVSLDAARWLTFSQLKSALDQLLRFKESNPALLGLSYFAIYVCVTALSLPGAVVMTLAGGAVFGLLWGTILVSFASSLGALSAFLVARYLLRDTLEKKFDAALNSLNQGVKREGAFYLFSLRLVPLVPFFLINLLSGLTRMRATTFYWVSQVGMFAGTVVYVNAGTQLAQLESPSGILSLPMMLSFAALGLFPWLAKLFIHKMRVKKVYAKFKKPEKFDRNLIVIGAGAAGLVTSYIAAAVRAKVTLIEGHKMGGDCLNFGCVPSKAIIQCAKTAHHIRRANTYGVQSGEVKVSFPHVMQRVRDVITQIEPHDSVDRYTQLGVDVRKGHARILDPWTVEITTEEGQRLAMTSKNIVIATGARPIVPAIPGLEKVRYVTSDTIWKTFSERDSTPAKLVVLGGGPIGCELAQAFARLGSQVTLIERAPTLMSSEDPEVSDFVQKEFRAEGIVVVTDAKVIRAENVDGHQNLVIETPQGESIVPFDDLLIAVGREARLKGFGLEELGIPSGKTIQTNEYLETIYPNIFAAGDVAGPYQLTHVAAHQAWYASVNALFGAFRRFKVDYSVIPAVTFLDPEIARVGLNEKQARARNIDFETVHYDISDLDRAIADGQARGWVKVLTARGSDRILGATIVSAHAGELLSEFVLAMKNKIGLKKILATIHPYPTWAEANKYSAGEWSRAHAPEKILRVLEQFHSWMRS